MANINKVLISKNNGDSSSIQIKFGRQKKSIHYGKKIHDPFKFNDSGKSDYVESTQKLVKFLRSLKPDSLPLSSDTSYDFFWYPPEKQIEENLMLLGAQGSHILELWKVVYIEDVSAKFRGFLLNGLYHELLNETQIQKQQVKDQLTEFLIK